MNRKFLFWLLTTVLVTTVSSLRRSSRRKSRGLGFCREGARPIPRIPIRAAKHSGEGYEISVTSRKKIFWLTIAMLTERRTVSQAL